MPITPYMYNINELGLNIKVTNKLGDVSTAISTARSYFRHTRLANSLQSSYTSRRDKNLSRT